ncbi:DUF6567 family protein [Marinifilum sp. RC60d5]|uniref:DUF6567 family protein n=1 Tax=Marinifilum sp. RC60d5 TaxID=3458414 RepID=UPI004037070F
MKKISFLLVGVTLLFSSCAIHNGLTTNSNNHETQVVLAKKNFKLVKNVKGESKATYIFGIGGHARQAMIEEAKSKMLRKADMMGSSKAIINETVEIKHSLFPFFRKYELTVSGQVVEFTE